MAAPNRLKIAFNSSTSSVKYSTPSITTLNFGLGSSCLLNKFLSRFKIFLSQSSIIRLYKRFVSTDRLLMELPMIPSYEKKENGGLLWIIQLEKKFFYRYQREVFRCHLLVFNKKVCIAYDGSSRLSREYAKFVRANLPKDVRDVKRMKFNFVQQ